MYSVHCTHLFSHYLRIDSQCRVLLQTKSVFAPTKLQFQLTNKHYLLNTFKRLADWDLLASSSKGYVSNIDWQTEHTGSHRSGWSRGAGARGPSAGGASPGAGSGSGWRPCESTPLGWRLSDAVSASSPGGLLLPIACGSCDRQRLLASLLLRAGRLCVCVCVCVCVCECVCVWCVCVCVCVCGHKITNARL